MSSLLIVDGHSALFSSRELVEEHEVNPRRARQMLVDRLNLYQGATGHAVVVVFDGRGSEDTREGGTEGEALVIYSKHGSSADAVIERLASAQAPKRRVTVASNDRMVLEAAMASGAEGMSISTLEEEITRQVDSFRGKWGIG